MDIKDIAVSFELDGDIIFIGENNVGLINKSYVVKTTKKKYIIQKINSNVFPNPKQLMENIRIVTEYLSDKENNCESLALVKTKTGEYYLENNNEYYRCYNYLTDSITFEKPINYKQLAEMGKIIGRFHKNLFDIDIEIISETITEFHNTISRYNKLVDSFKHASSFKQQEVMELYTYVISQESKLNKINQLIDDNSIPKRIVHNDTKFNNVIFNKNTLKSKCLIDLDTVMPGTILFDYGDALRSAGSNLSEESVDFDNLDFNLDNFIYFTIGYLKEVKSDLTELELDLLYDSILTITLECGMRFLTDYLDGNKYFLTKYEKHNLNRSINQLILAKKIEDKENIIKKLIKIIIFRI